MPASRSASIEIRCPSAPIRLQALGRCVKVVENAADEDQILASRCHSRGRWAMTLVETPPSTTSS